MINKHKDEVEKSKFLIILAFFDSIKKGREK